MISGQWLIHTGGIQMEMRTCLSTFPEDIQIGENNI